MVDYRHRRDNLCGSLPHSVSSPRHDLPHTGISPLSESRRSRLQEWSLFRLAVGERCLRADASFWLPTLFRRLGSPCRIGHCPASRPRYVLADNGNVPELTGERIRWAWRFLVLLSGRWWSLDLVAYHPWATIVQSLMVSCPALPGSL